MSNQFLNDILEHKKGLIEKKKAFFSSLKKQGIRCQTPHAFAGAIGNPDRINLIAEIKKASPSKGIIREDFDPVAIARIYEEHKAAAISVLTEDKYFLGQPEFIKDISARVKLPILTKDFIIDEGQIYEACANGAGAILLIVAILEDQPLKHLLNTAENLGLDVLIEVHNEEDCERALAIGAKMIGINNRDLKTFEVDRQTSRRLAPKIPKGITIVAESGITSHKEVLELADLGARAVLIGEVFMREKDIRKKIKEIMGY